MAYSSRTSHRSVVPSRTSLYSHHLRYLSDCSMQLFGHELVGLLCGVTWGIGVGFGIVALGTLLGEVANFL